MRCLWICTVGLNVATGLSAQPSSFCDEVSGAMAAAQSLGKTADTVEITLPGGRPIRAACSFSIDLSGSKSTNCNWAFPYRSLAATEAFVRMSDELATCSDPDFGIEQDQRVNHPDFYDLRLFRVSDGKVGLSLKDKAALQRTYVFLRTTPTR